jgi:hypothetical protein
MSLNEYLQKHFVDKPTFASLAGISPERLDRLIAAEAIPRATYICDGSSIRSAAFGATEIHEALWGEYFRPECTRWAKIAAQATPGAERAAVLAELTGELNIALQNHIEDSVLTANGSDACPPSISQSELLQLISSYASSAMPFSPAEYARSSRKRLVDDLRPAVAKA